MKGFVRIRINKEKIERNIRDCIERKVDKKKIKKIIDKHIKKKEKVKT